MKILFDQGVPVPLRRFLHPSSVDTATENGWSQLTNGSLIESAERDGYDVLTTTDQNLRYQQNLTHRKIAILILKITSWPRIKKSVQKGTEELQKVTPTAFLEIDLQGKPRADPAQASHEETRTHRKTPGRNADVPVGIRNSAKKASIRGTDPSDFPGVSIPQQWLANEFHEVSVFQAGGGLRQNRGVAAS
ncbi:MAG: hypothetical protein ACKOEZ_05585 [Spartobacteria bacterium]